MSSPWCPAPPPHRLPCAQQASPRPRPHAPPPPPLQVRLALRLRAVAARHTLAGAAASLHAGLHCGPVAGAVVGAHRAFYCLYGDTVPTGASRNPGRALP